MPSLNILDLVWTEWNVDHIARGHDLTPDQVEEALRGPTTVRSSYKGRLMVFGQLGTGRVIAVILEPVEGEEGIYFPVTARPADRKERRLYREAIEGGEQT